MKIGLIKECKFPVDKRVIMTPYQCKLFKNKFPQIELVVQSSEYRCFTDEEYMLSGTDIVNDVSDCDILFGVKEVPLELLLYGKTYFFFSHTIKMQPYNRNLLSCMLDLKVKMIDYEVLKNNGKRLLGFGRYAGVVGCYNGILTYGKRTQLFNLKPAYLCADRKELESELKKVNLGNSKIIVTGNGRVGKGALEIIKLLAIKEVSKADFKNNKYDVPVYVHLDFSDYNVRIDGSTFLSNDFFSNPKLFRSTFMDYASCADILIAGHYYAQGSPYLFTREDVKSTLFNIRTVADISCDINGPVASTIRSSTIQNPIYGYNPVTETEDEFDKDSVISVMAVDNLPCELPKDSSEDFGSQMLNEIFPLLFNCNDSDVIKGATICDNGDLTSDFEYLRDFLEQIK
jgi:alanine dehydrogenase